MRRWPKRVGIGLLAIFVLAVFAGAGGFLWLRTSLPQVDGSVAVAGSHDKLTIERDDRGVVTIRAQSLDDASFGLGFAHAQDRLFQMDMMRRLGAGRLSEVIGAQTVPVDRLMRTLDLKHIADRQAADASPALKAILKSYAAGVNAFLDQRSGALPPEFLLLGYRPERWQPADSLLWGRIMALQLSANQHEERLNLELRHALPADLFKLLVPEARQQAGLPSPWFGPLDLASNNWVVGPEKSLSGEPILANDPHLGLGAPAIWYLAHIVTPDRSWVGATSPGMPMMIIGASDDVAWGFTTTGGDTEDLFEERAVPSFGPNYDTPGGTAAFELRKETIKVKGGADVSTVIRDSRHGPIVSDLDEDRQPDDPILALASASALPDDRTPDALLAMNLAHTADEFRAALAGFATPEQNVVFADRAGHIGFVAAGRVPVRRSIYRAGLLPAPGWSGEFDWVGTLPFSALPQTADPSAGWLATANNKIVGDDYPSFIAGHWADDGRYRRIAELLQAKSKLGVADFESMQMDILSRPLLDLIRDWLKRISGEEPDIARMLAQWDGKMDRRKPEPLIASLWVQRTAEHVFGKRLSKSFGDWWFWDDQALKRFLADDRWCISAPAPGPADCGALLSQSLKETVSDLKAKLGADPAQWKWGDVHRMHFQHPIFRSIPMLSTWLDPELPTDGDNFTLNRGVPISRPGSIQMPDVHGPTMRFIVDLKEPMAAVATLAGGQSGNPLSEHYADGLADWRDGRYRTIVQPPVHTLTLLPKP